MSGENDTEKSILDGVLSESDSGGTEDASVETTQETTQQTGATRQPDATTSSGGNKKPTGQQRQGTEQQQQQQQQTTQQTGGRNPGDLVDQQGRIIARAGAERRIFERAANYIKPIYDAKMRELQTQIDTLQQATNDQQFGLTPQQGIIGRQMMQAWLKNPTELVRYLLTELKKSGQNIEGVGNGVDTQAIQDMLDERLAPILQDREAAQQQQEIVAGVQQEYDSFIGRYPDARLHEEDIASLLREDDSLSPEVAYFRLQNFALRNGLDWNRPLKPQIEAIIAQRGRQGGNGNRPLRGMPTGRGSATVQGRAAASDGSVAHESTPTRDIVRNAMRQAGFQI